MIFSVVYLLVRRLLGCLMVLARGEVSKDAELLVVRHENVWVPRTSSTSRDQAIFVDQATGAILPSDPVLTEIDRLG